MKAEFWVLLTATRKRSGHWYMSAVPQARINKPTAAANQIAVRMTVDVPDSFFEEPQIHAKITIPDSGETRQEITAELQQQLAERLKGEFGLKVTFTPRDAQ